MTAADQIPAGRQAGPSGPAAAAPSARAEWRQNWTVVGGSVVGMALGSLHAYSLGVMIPSLEEEFGWSRAAISSGMLISAVISVLLSPFFGMLIDRFGPRRIALTGVSFYCAALALLGTATSEIWVWWALWTMLAFALLTIKPTVWVAAISSLFNRSRGLALAVVLSATGLSQAVTPVLTYRLISYFDWRAAYVTLGVGAAIIALPLIYFFFSSAQDRVRRAGPPATAGTAAAPALSGLTVRQGLRSGAFTRLAIGALAMSIAGGALTVNLVPILIGSSISIASAAGLAGLSGVFAIVGRMSGGYLIDRFNARIVGGVSVFLPTLSCLLLLGMPGSIPMATLAVIINGLAAGAEMDAIAYLAGRSFGLRNFGTLFGTLAGILALGVGLGPLLANLCYDLTGSYAPVLWAIIPLSIAASLSFATVPAYPKFEAGEEPAR